MVRSRSQDPQTSKAAGESVDVTACFRVLKAAKSLRVPFSAANVAELAAKVFGGNTETYRKRVAELRKLGHLQQVGTKVCEFSGRTVMTYQLARR